MKIKVGDHVRFLNDVGEAKVLKIIDEHMALIEDESGFDYAHPIKELLIVHSREDEKEAYGKVEPNLRDILDRNIDKRAVKKAEEDFEVKYKNKEATRVQRKGEYMEIDLHIHELVDSERGLESRDKIDIQIRHFERMLKIAEEKKIRRVIFIHGVGQGVLRLEIRKLLNQYYPNATFHDADFNEYGHGATEVRLVY